MTAGGINVYGTYGMKGNTLVYDIMYVKSAVEKGQANLVQLLKGIEDVAAANGANTVQINGSNVVNAGFNKFIEMAKNNGGQALGWTVTQSGSDVTLTKTISQ